MCYKQNKNEKKEQKKDTDIYDIKLRETVNHKPLKIIQIQSNMEA